jgi:lipopolysaccharide/colanic/teichoic acid biosynthesis glycosyltransferase
MIASKALLITSHTEKVESPLPLPPITAVLNGFPPCTLKGKQGKLFVRCVKPGTQVQKLSNDEWLKNFWYLSTAQTIYLDPRLGEKRVKFWADFGESINKPVALRLPSTLALPQKCRPRSWVIKRSLDWIVAASLLLLFSPLMLALILLISLHSPGPIFFQQWRVGERGKLFRILKFRTMRADAEHLHDRVMSNQSGLHKREDDPRVTPLGRWMRKYSLDELPQLLNVLRGEMSLVGPRPWALYDALRIERQSQHRLNALPGITGAWQVTARSNLQDLAAVNQLDLEYLGHWSLGEDLKILLLTPPKVLSGFGAY